MSAYGDGSPGDERADGEQAGVGVPARCGGDAVVPPQGDGGPPPSPDLPPSDADLIRRLREGDNTAYEELYRRHAAAVRRYARTCCRDADTAEDLTAEVFARTLQAMRGGSGPRHAVRAYLLTTVRHTAAAWTRTARREQLVDDFAAFAEQAVGGGRAELSNTDTLELGADVRAMQEAERSLALEAFRSLPERWQAVLWHTEVEDESPSEVATLFGLDANGTRVLASRAREGLKQAYLQAHVSSALASDGECARYTDRLGAYARGRLRTRAERGLRKHLEECARCRVAAGQIDEVARGIPAAVPIAVIGWFGAAGYAKVAALVAGGAGVAGGSFAGTAAGGTGAGAAGGTGAGAGAGAGAGTGSGAGAGGAVSEGIGGPVKAGIAAGVVAVAAAVIALALVGEDSPAHRPEAHRPAASAPAVEPEQPAPADPPEAPVVPERAPVPAAEPHPAPPASPTPRPAPPAAPAPPSPRSPAPESPKPRDPAPTPSPTPSPAPAAYRWSSLAYGVVGDGSGPEMRLGASSWVWQRSSGVSVAGKRYGDGVTVVGRSDVTVDLNRPCTAFDALAGVDDLTTTPGRVIFSVYGDGVPLWHSVPVEAGDPAVPVHVDLTGRRTVRLVVTPDNRFGNLALADWADSRFACG